MGLTHRAFCSGDVLLSHGLSPYYHRGCSVSLPCSEWERVVPLRYCHQKSALTCGADFWWRRFTETAMAIGVNRPYLFFRKNMIFNRRSQIENPQFFWFSDIYIQEVKGRV